MYVRYGFTIEIYGFTHTLRTCLARDTHDAIAIEVASRFRTQRKEDDKYRDIEDS